MTTLRMAPWLPGSVIVTTDLESTSHQEIAQSPRSILKAQIARLEAMDLGD
jgi:glutamine synthetase